MPHSAASFTAKPCRPDPSCPSCSHGGPNDSIRQPQPRAPIRVVSQQQNGPGRERESTLRLRARALAGSGPRPTATDHIGQRSSLQKTPWKSRYAVVRAPTSFRSSRSRYPRTPNRREACKVQLPAAQRRPRLLPALTEKQQPKNKCPNSRTMIRPDWR